MGDSDARGPIYTGRIGLRALWGARMKRAAGRPVDLADIAPLTEPEHRA